MKRSLEGDEGSDFDSSSENLIPEEATVASKEIEAFLEKPLKPSTHPPAPTNRSKKGGLSKEKQALLYKEYVGHLDIPSRHRGTFIVKINPYVFDCDKKTRNQVTQLLVRWSKDPGLCHRTGKKLGIDPPEQNSNKEPLRSGEPKIPPSKLTPPRPQRGASSITSLSPYAPPTMSEEHPGKKQGSFFCFLDCRSH